MVPMKEPFSEVKLDTAVVLITATAQCDNGPVRQRQLQVRVL